MNKDPSSAQVISRLDRMEKKMDQMAAALVSMARTEERVAKLLSADTEKTKWIAKLQEKVHALEVTGAKSTTINRYLERVFWIIFTAAVGGIAAYFQTIK